jgi:hypothetical protein
MLKVYKKVSILKKFSEIFFVLLSHRKKLKNIFFTKKSQKFEFIIKFKQKNIILKRKTPKINAWIRKNNQVKQKFGFLQ